jgi:hypothetical protein
MLMNMRKITRANEVVGGATGPEMRNYVQKADSYESGLLAWLHINAKQAAWNSVAPLGP